MKKRIARAMAVFCTGCVLTTSALPEMTVGDIGTTQTISSESEKKAESGSAKTVTAKVKETSKESKDTKVRSDSKSEKDKKQKAKSDNKEKYGFNNLGLANVQTVLNVREEAGLDSKVVGRMTADSACEIEKYDSDWTKISSGKVKGYAKTEYLLTGKAAEDRADVLINDTVTVNASVLRVREDASVDSHIISRAENGTKLTVATEIEALDEDSTSAANLENKGKTAKVAKASADDGSSDKNTDISKDDKWLEVRLDDNTLGYVASEYVTETKTLQTAEVVMDENSEDEESDSGGAPPGQEAPPGETEKNDQTVNEQPQEAAPAVDKPSETQNDSDKEKSSGSKKKKKHKSHKSEETDVPVPVNMDPASYALQFVGNPYVWGGSSLTNGADCSGFVMAVYAHFGISLPHSSAAQSAYGNPVSAADAKRGDLFFYGSGGINHVAIYLGDGRIVHASNSRDGIKISNAFYRNPICVRRLMEVR